MKKYIFVFLLGFISALSLNSYASDSFLLEPVNITINSIKANLSRTAFTYNDASYISVKDASNLFAANTTWDAKTNTVDISKSNIITDSRNTPYVSLLNDKNFIVSTVEYDEFKVTYIPTKNQRSFYLDKDAVQVKALIYFNLEAIRSMIK